LVRACIFGGKHAQTAGEAPTIPPRPMRCIIRAAMDIHLEQVLAILREIFDEMEDLWSEAETYKAMLVVRGLTDQELATSAMNSRATPECRKAAQENYAERRKRLENAVKKALIAELSENSPPDGESN
jgi:hypothetical protein